MGNLTNHIVRLCAGLLFFGALIFLGHPAMALSDLEKYENCLRNGTFSRETCYCLYIAKENVRTCRESGEPSGGGGSRLSQGSVYQGTLYSTMPEAVDACEEELRSSELEDTHECGLRDFYGVTNNPDSFLVLQLSSDAVAVLNDDDGGPPTPPIISPAGNSVCLSSVLQDTSLSFPGCQAGFGCREKPPSIWQGQGCATGIGCCNNATGCVVSGGADGIYGTSSTVCQN